MGASFGGGGGVGAGPAFSSAGGGGGYWGGGGGSGGGGGGGGGGTGFVIATAIDDDLETSGTTGAPVHTADTGYVAGVAVGGSAMTPHGGDGLVLLSW
jgi:hypothetical protein